MSLIQLIQLKDARRRCLAPFYLTCLGTWTRQGCFLTNGSKEIQILKLYFWLRSQNFSLLNITVHFTDKEEIFLALHLSSGETRLHKMLKKSDQKVISLLGKLEGLSIYPYLCFQAYIQRFVASHIHRCLLYFITDDFQWKLLFYFEKMPGSLIKAFKSVDWKFLLYCFYISLF